MYLITLDGRVFAQTGYNDPAHFVTDAKVTSKTDGSGSFDFTIYRSHQYYSKIFKMKSTVRVYLNKIEIFNGRVLEIEDDFIEGKRSIYCEGALSYFIDSVLPGIETTESTLFDYICDIVKQHNEQVNPDRQFVVGLLDNKHLNDTIPIKRDSYSSCSDALSEIVEEYGGFFKVRSSGSQLFLDYIEEYSNKAKQPLEIGVNVNSASVKVSSDDIFTILIPGGKDGLTIEEVNDGKNYLVDEEGIEKYGRITATVGFDDIENAEELFNKAKEYLEKFASGKPKTISVEAIDLSALGYYPPIFAGDRVRLRLNQNDSFSEYTCTSVEYDLINPENTKYEFGTPESSMTSKMNSANIQFKKDIQDNTRRIGDAETDIKVNARDIEVNARDIEVNARDIEVNARDIEVNARDIEVNAENFDLRAGKIEEVQVTLDGRVTETEDGLTRVTEENTRIMQRLTLAEIEINGDEGTIGLKTQYALLDGRVTSLDDSYETLAARVNTVGEVASQAKIDIDAQAGTIKEIASRTEVLETDYAGIEKRVGNAEIDIDAAKADILLKADQSVVNELQNTVSQAQIDIDGANAKITAETERVDNLTGEVTSAKLDIDAANKAITAEVTRATTEEGKLAGRIKVTEDSITEQAGQIDAQGKLISGAQEDIDGLNKSITDIAGDVSELDGSLSGVRTKLDGVEKTVTTQAGTISEQGELIEGAQQRIDGLTGEISQTVKKDGLISAINQSAEKITISASKVNLVGYVTATSLETDYLSAIRANFTSLTSGTLRATNLTSDGFTGDHMQLSGNATITGDLTIHGFDFDLHGHNIVDNEDGTFSIGKPGWANLNSFKIADTKTYKDGVSAAKNSVKVSGSWSGGRYTARTDAPNPQSASTYISGGISTITYNGETGQPIHSYTIDTPIMYSDGPGTPERETGYIIRRITGTEAYDAGYSAGKTSGSDITIDAGTWSGGTFTVKMTNASGSVLKSATTRISGTATATYDSTSHKYSISAPVKYGDQGQGSTGYTITGTSGTEAYEAGFNNVTVRGTPTLTNPAQGVAYLSLYLTNGEHYTHQFTGWGKV